MAGLGTIFVELDLDVTKFEKNQRTLINSANSAALSIEKNFQNLGVKSDAIYEAMRRSAVNSLDMIKAKSTSTGNEIARAQAATAARLKQIDTEQFGHHDTLLETMKANWIKAAAVITASMLTIRKGWEMIKEGAEYSEQVGILDNLAAKYETTAESIVGSMRYASSEMISNADLTSVALEGLAKGLKPDQLIELSDAAKILADTTGVTATTALNELTQALETGRIKGLKGYAGGTVDLKDALGDLESQLTAAEKTQAMFALVMIHATQLQEQQTKAVDESADSIEKLEAKYKNLTTTISVAFKTLVVEMEAFISKYGSGGMTPWAIGYQFIQKNLFTKKATPGGVIVPEPGEQTQEQKADAAKTKYEKQIEALKTTLEKRKELEAAAKKSASGGGGSTDNSASEIAKDTYEKAISDAEYYAKMQVTAGKDALTAKLESLDKQEAALKTYYETEKSLAAGSKEKLSALELTYTEDSNKYALERAKIIREQELNTLELKKASTESQLELDKKSVELAKEIYDAKAKYGGTSNLDDLKAEYEVKRKSLEIDYQKLEAELSYAKAKGDSNAKEKEILEILKKQKLIKAEIYTLTEKEAVASLEYTGNFFEGWSSGIAKWSKDAKSEFQNAQDMAKTTADAMKTAFSDGFYKLIKGESVSITDIFSTMFDTILKKFTDMCAEMVIKWITSKEAMALAGTAISTGASAIGSILGGLFHEGGIVGESYGASRLLPAYAFAGAPRLHNGLAADEYPAILQKGEEVIPKSKVGQQSEKSSEGAQITQNTITINAIDSKSFADICKRNPSALMGPVMSSMKSNKTRNDMRKLLK